MHMLNNAFYYIMLIKSVWVLSNSNVPFEIVKKKCYNNKTKQNNNKNTEEGIVRGLKSGNQ